MIDLRVIFSKAVNAIAKTLQSQRSSAEAQLNMSRKLLTNSDCTGVGAWLAASNILGTELLIWEPETVTIELDEAVRDIPDVVFDKINAAKSILIAGDNMPVCTWDAVALEKTALAFNSEEVEFGCIQIADPPQLNWGMFEITAFMTALVPQGINYSETHNLFDYEPIQYIAASLSRAGFLLAPQLLSDAQDALDKINVGKQNVSAESPEQIEKHTAVRAYTDTRAQQLKRELDAVVSVSASNLIPAPY